MKRMLIILLIVSLIFAFPSCRKKTDEKNSGVQLSAPSMLQASSDETEKSSSSAAEVSSFPVFKRAQPSDEKNSAVSSPEDSTSSLAITSPDEKKPLLYVNEAERESSIEPFELNMVYRGGDLLVKAVLCRDSGELVFNTDESEIRKIIAFLSLRHSLTGEISYVLTESTLKISYPESTEETVEEEWQEFRACLNSYNAEKASLVNAEENELIISKSGESVKGRITASIYSDRSEILLPPGMSEEDTCAFISWLLSIYPEALQYGTYSIVDGTVVLTYSSSFSNRMASDDFDCLISLLDEFFSPSGVSSSYSTGENEKESSFISDSSAPAASVEKEDRTQLLSPPVSHPSDVVERKADFIKGYRVTAYITPSFNTGDSSLSLIAGAGAEVDFTPWLSLGIRGGWNFSLSALDAGLYARFTLLDFEKAEIYASLGASLAFSHDLSSPSFSSALSFGAGYKITENLSLYGEIGCRYALMKGFSADATIALSYSF